MHGWLTLFTWGILAHDDAGILTAKPKGVTHCNVNRCSPSLVRHVVEVTGRIGLLHAKRIVGGIVPASSDVSVAATLIAPAAPRVCPIMLLMLLTGTA